jgi:hypothetical protein
LSGDGANGSAWVSAPGGSAARASAGTSNTIAISKARFMGVLLQLDRETAQAAAFIEPAQSRGAH